MRITKVNLTVLHIFSFELQYLYLNVIDKGDDHLETKRLRDIFLAFESTKNHGVWISITILNLYTHKMSNKMQH
jgi:hypothetical protein